MAQQNKNPWYRAKDVIIEDYNNKKITDDMDARQVYDMEDRKDIFHLVQWDRFRDNFRNLKKRGFTKPSVKKVNPWYVAKPILHEDYVAKQITDDMDIIDVHNMKTEFKNVDFERFKTNFTKLKERIDKDQARAELDFAGYQRDILVHKLAKDIDGEWNGSRAEKMLKEAVNNDVHKEMKPKELYLSNDTYKEFSYNTFRNHLYQETRSKKDSAYWLVKKKKKEKKVKAKLEGRRYREDDNDFYDPVLNFCTMYDWPM